MSTNINHSKMERALDIECAVIAKNPRELYRLAIQAKKEGDDEQAEALFQMYEDVMETIREAQEEMHRDDEDYVEVAPGLYQDRAAYEGNMAYDEMRDNEVY